MSENYSVDYWYNDSSHSAWDFGGEKYYVNTFYEEIIKKLDIPDNGKILVLGTHNCVSFDKLCKHFGYNRCLGYDIANPKNHPNVIIKNCMIDNQAAALSMAQAHCSGYGKNAVKQPDDRPDGLCYYECKAK